MEVAFWLEVNQEWGVTHLRNFCEKILRIGDFEKCFIIVGQNFEILPIVRCVLLHPSFLIDLKLKGHLHRYKLHQIF